MIYAIGIICFLAGSCLVVAGPLIDHEANRAEDE